MDPRGQEYLWIGSGTIRPSTTDGADCDTSAFHAGAISLTPLSTDATAAQGLGLARRMTERVGKPSSG